MAGPIRIAILANASQARKEIDGISATAGKIGDSFAKFRLPATAALAGIGIGAKKAIDGASDLNEVLSKTDQIFGTQSAAVKTWAQTTDKSMGLSQTAALDAATTFGLIGQKAGLGGRETAAFAQKFTGLAGDLASFNNTTPEEAIEAIGAAMRGESEPIRKYGVLLDDATLRARALKLGLIASTKDALTPQQKALAASQEILAQTTKAQGDFSRTSTGAANSQRIQAAQAANLSAQLGQALLPAYTKALSIGNQFLGFLSQHGKATQIVIAALAALAAIVLAAGAAQKVAAAATLIYKGVMGGVAAATKVWAAAQAALNIVMSLNPVALIIIGIVALIAIIALIATKTKFFQTVWRVVWTAVKVAAAAVVGWFTGTLVPSFKRAWDQLNAGVRAVKAFFVNNFNAMRSAAQAVWNGIVAVVRGAVTAVLNTVRGIINVVTTIRNAFNNARNAAATAIGSLVTLAAGIPGRVVRAVGNLGSSLYGVGRDLIQGMIRGIRNMIGNLVGSVRDAIGNIPGAAKKLLGIGSPSKVFRGFGQDTIRGYIEGLRRQRRSLDRFMGDTFTFVDGGLTPRPSVALAGGGAVLAAPAAAPIVINLSGVITDPVATGRAVVKAIQAHEAVSGARWRQVVP